MPGTPDGAACVCKQRASPLWRSNRGPSAGHWHGGHACCPRLHLSAAPGGAAPGAWSGEPIAEVGLDCRVPPPSTDLSCRGRDAGPCRQARASAQHADGWAALDHQRHPPPSRRRGQVPPPPTVRFQNCLCCQLRARAEGRPARASRCTAKARARPSKMDAPDTNPAPPNMPTRKNMGAWQSKQQPWRGAHGPCARDPFALQDFAPEVPPSVAYLSLRCLPG